MNVLPPPSRVALLLGEAEAHRALHHPYLDALENGTLPDPVGALRRFTAEYAVYTKSFQNYLLPWIKPAQKPFYMGPEGGYLSSVDVPFPGRIWRRDGESVEVQAVHKTFTTYFKALHAAGFTAMPHVEELHITADHVALDPDFFGPLVDLPLHVAFSLSP